MHTDRPEMPTKRADAEACPWLGDGTVSDYDIVLHLPREIFATPHRSDKISWFRYPGLYEAYPPRESWDFQDQDTRD